MAQQAAKIVDTFPKFLLVNAAVQYALPAVSVAQSSSESPFDLVR